MKINDIKLSVSAVRKSQFPDGEEPEFLLVGRSNVGKSSFINTLVNRKNYARTSSRPGKTQTLNFYNIDDKFYFVDLPGYGYSKMSKVEQARVNSFIDEYLHIRKNISLIIFLIDIRHSPTENDRLMYQYIINTNSPCLIVANKSDKIAVTKVSGVLEDLQQELNPLKDLTFLPFSAERKIYSEDVWNYIENYI